MHLVLGRVQLKKEFLEDFGGYNGNNNHIGPKTNDTTTGPTITYQFKFSQSACWNVTLVLLGNLK